MTERLFPTTFKDAALALREASAAGKAVRLAGARTKSDWAEAGAEPAVEIASAALGRIVEHNAGDLTAVLEAGVPLAEAQSRFASVGQMLALDPPLGAGERATIGGIVATGDSGPLRHRYGDVRDLVIGITVALSDGTIARSGGKVIKNVAGYDLAKLFCGSFGTLGMILAVNVRLHPTSPASATAIGTSDDPGLLSAAALKLAAAPLELDALDVAWRDGRGELLARASGADPAKRSSRAAESMRDMGLGSVEELHDDDAHWERQRAAQRSSTAALVRIATRPSVLGQVLALARDLGGSLVGRAALGTSYLECSPDAARRVRESLPDGAIAVVLDGAVEADRWGPVAAPAIELMHRVKGRFDPAGTCNPGTFVGGL